MSMLVFSLTDGRVIRLRPIIAETGPIGVGTPTKPTPPAISSAFVDNHRDFINQVSNLEHCFYREEILHMAPEEVEEHIQIALQDNFILEDGNTGRFCTMQVVNDLKEQLKGYVWKSSY